MRHETVRVNGIDLHVRSMGDAQAPLMLFLHGFPEYSGAWDEVLPAFAGDFHAVAPDQRGYARSSKPEGLEAYRIKPLVRDILALGEHYSPGRPFVLVAHDWGASVAYATAIAAPNRVARLVVINGVHPGPFQRALIEDEAQRKASAYIHYLRAPEAEERLSANNFEKLLGMLTRFGPQPWLTPRRSAPATWRPGASRARSRPCSTGTAPRPSSCRRRARRWTRQASRSSIRRSCGCACRISWSGAWTTGRCCPSRAPRCPTTAIT